MPTLSNSSWISLEPTLKGEISITIKWLSVPSLTTLIPCFWNSSAIALAFKIICFWYFLKDGFIASKKQTALAAITWSNGPPCIPGKTALSIFWAKFIFPLGSILSLILDKINPPRGPLNVLWVVVVTTSQ